MLKKKTHWCRQDWPMLVIAMCTQKHLKTTINTVLILFCDAFTNMCTLFGNVFGTNAQTSRRTDYATSTRSNCNYFRWIFMHKCWSLCGSMFRRSLQINMRNMEKLMQSYARSPIESNIVRLFGQYSEKVCEMRFDLI